MTVSDQAPGFNALLGMTLKGVRGADYVVELAVEDHHLHDAGLVHGGVLLALLDTAMSRAVRAQVDATGSPGEATYWPTLELNTHFFRPARNGVVTACGRVINRSRRSCYAEAEVRDAEGRLLAKAAATLLATERPNASRS